MKLLNEKELNLVNAGRFGNASSDPEKRAEKIEKLRHEEWLKWVNQEKRKMEGLADIRIRAAENALKAAMRLDRAEMEIKAAQRAAMDQI